MISFNLVKLSSQSPSFQPQFERRQTSLPGRFHFHIKNGLAGNEPVDQAV